MTIAELFELIKGRIDADISIKDAVCETYGAELVRMHAEFKKGQENAPIAFAAQWMPWVLGKKLITLDEIKQMVRSDQVRLGILVGAREFKVDDGRHVVIDSVGRASGSARVFCYDNSQVTLFDEATAHLYDHSIAFVKSGWVHAFESTKVLVAGQGVVEAWDNAEVSVRGACMVRLNGNAKHHLDGVNSKALVL